MDEGVSETETKSWIDAAGVIRWGAQPPTGIQRVETTICKRALETGAADFAIFDVIGSRYRPLSRRERAFFTYIIEGRWPSDTAPYAERLRSAFAYLDIQLSHPDNETARRLAFALSGFRRRSGIAYALAKYGLRIMQMFMLLFRFLRTRLGALAGKLAGVSERWAPAGAVVLVSHEVNRDRFIDRALARAGLRGVHIVHDLIPVLMPELVTSRFHAGMNGFLRRILAKPEPIISVSHATRDDLVAWNRDVVKAPYPFAVKVCPLGAALVSTEGESEPVPDLPERPYAVFCSTFDIRKNQHLLVSVWSELVRRLGPERVPDLLLIGRPGNSSSLVREELEKAPHIADKVHIRSGISDKQLRWAYRNALIGLFPSSAEGWGLGVSECLANGLPVVHADVPALREAAQNLMPVLPAGDLEAWTSTLLDLFEHPGKIAALRADVERDYDRSTPDGFAGCVLSYLGLLAREGFDAAKAVKGIGLDA